MDGRGALPAVETPRGAKLPVLLAKVFRLRPETTTFLGSPRRPLERVPTPS